MIELHPSQYALAAALVRGSKEELSVAATLAGWNPGQVLVDSPEKPRAAVIRTTETTVVAGDASYRPAWDGMRAALGFMEPVMADTPDWETVLGQIHPNPCLRRVLRRQYTADRLAYRDYRAYLPAGLALERLTEAHFDLENGDTVRHWAQTWGISHFFADGAGYVIRDGDILCAWSLTDCRTDTRAAIGIVTDPRYRRRGLAAIAAAANADHWFTAGIETLEWLCFDVNVGSQATARRVGFAQAAVYAAWMPAPTFENDGDLTPAQWAEWDDFLRARGAYTEHPAEYAAVEARIARILAR